MNTCSIRKDVPGMTFLFAFYVILTSSFSTNPDNGSPASQALYNTIASLDSSLFASIYTNNSSKNSSFFTEDLEFYHDKKSFIKSRQAFIEMLENGFYGEQKELIVRRELVEGSMKVYPLNSNGIMYGAVQTGEHRFYGTYKNGKERLSGTAKFTHVWLNKEGKWKISRVISYNHRSAR